MSKPIVKYFINGQYREATVSDVGDLEKLKTSIKTDLVSAINSIYSGEGNIQDKLDQFNKEVGSIADEVKNLDLEFEKQKSEIKKQLEESIKQSTLEMLEMVEKVAQEDLKRSEQYKQQVEKIYNDYKQSESELNKSIDSTNREVTATKESLKEYQEKLSSMEVGINEVSASIDEVDGKLTGYAKKTDFDLMEARVREAENQIEITADGLKQKATKGELDSAIQRVAKFEGELEATAKKLESKLTREEVIQEIDNEREYGANLLKGSRDWQDWSINGKAEKLAETYRNKTLINIHSDNDSLQYTVNGLEIGETYTFSISAMTKVEGVTVLVNGIEMKQQSNEDTILGEGYHRLYANIIPKKSTETLTVTVKGLTNGVVNVVAPKLEKGSKNTAWLQHEDDIYEKTVKFESSLKQLADQFDLQIKSLKEIGKEVEEANTRINVTADGLSKVSEKVSNFDDKVAKVSSELKSLNNELSSKITSTELNSALDNLTIDGSNLIENSAFENGFENWKSVAKNFSIDEVNGLKYAKIKRTGVKSVSIDAITTHYFEVENHDRINVSFDVYSENPQQIDDTRIVFIELFNKTGERVARKEYRIEEIVGHLIANRAARAKFTYIVDREDVAKASVSLALYKNGHLSFTRLNVTKGFVKTIGWNPSPKDINVITTKLETDIKQKADKITVEATKKQVDDLASDFIEAKSEINATAENIKSEIQKVKGDMVKKSEMEQTAEGFKRQIVEISSDFTKKVENMELKHGEDSYSVHVISSKGNVFRNGIGDTRLMAVVYKGASEITNDIPESLFKWSRISDNPSKDAEWNSKHQAGSKFVDITSNDVSSQATFNCEVDIDEVEKILRGRA